MIVNNLKFYYIDTVSASDNEVPSIRYASAYQSLPIYSNHNYYYIEFKRSLSSLSECLIKDNVLHQLVHGDLYLALCNSHEAFHSVVDEVYEHAVIELAIPEHKIILISESADIVTEVNDVALQLGKHPIKTLWARIFEWAGNRYINSVLNGKTNPKLIDKSFGKAFLNFNRRWRTHRPALVALLFANNLLDRGYVSLAPVEGTNWELIWWSLVSYHNEEISTLLTMYKDDICNIPPLFLDAENMEVNRVEHSESVAYLYNDSYFSIVTETNYYANQPGRFFSEKVFKPVVMEHPFIIVSRPHSLAKFKELGYKSFSPYIDESYDEVEDDSERLLAIVNEIKRLSLLSPTELSEFLINVKPICDYNFKILLTKKNFITHLN
jgi:hypothetical protein